jgi:CHASE1-domain containing sensor protein
MKVYWQHKPNKGWRIVGLLLIALVLFLRFYVWGTIERVNAQTASDQFNAVVQRDTAQLTNRFETYADSLYSGRALFLTNGSVSRQNWTNFINAQHIKQRYPGVSGLSYVSVIDRSQLPDFTKQLNAGRLPTEKKARIVYPVSANKQLAVLTYLAPSGTDQQAIGYDLYTDSSRLKTLHAARDTGIPRASVPLTLVTDPKGTPTSLLLAMPVYKPSLPLSSVAERRSALQGFVVLSMYSRTLLDSIFAAGNTDENTLAVSAVTNNQLLYQTVTKPSGQYYHRSVSVTVAGQPWRLTFGAPKDFDLTATANVAPAIILGSTVPFVLLLCLALYFFMHMQALREHRKSEHRGSEHKQH